MIMMPAGQQGPTPSTAAALQLGDNLPRFVQATIHLVLRLVLRVRHSNKRPQIAVNALQNLRTPSFQNVVVGRQADRLQLI